MTNETIWEAALKQSAYDYNCLPEDFLVKKNKVIVSDNHELARKYLSPSIECRMTTYGNNIVAQTSDRLANVIEEYINKLPLEHCFEASSIQGLDNLLKNYGLQVYFTSEYFLPDLDRFKALTCDFELRILRRNDFKTLYTDNWSNALCEDRKELDVLAVGAYDGDKLVGLAGCSADCESMYQIGVDVLPEYRRKGIAAALTSRLTEEILILDKVPFYCAAWSNIKSVRNAVKCGFVPAWLELVVKRT